MQCSVENCFNFRNTNHNRIITLHALPKEPNLRKQWLKVVSGNNSSRSKIYICSGHFNINDFDGCQLKLDAVPSLIQVCRICLASDTKLYDMSGRGLTQSFEQITGVKVDSEDGLPQKLCWECHHRLSSYTQLRDKAMRSQFLMEDLLNATNYLTTEIITKAIDRETNSLTSNLTTKYFGVNYNDLLVQESNYIENEDDEKFTQIDEIQEMCDDVEIVIKEEVKFLSYDDYDNYNDEAISFGDEILERDVNKEPNIKVEKNRVDLRKIDLRQIDINDESFSSSDEILENDVKKRPNIIKIEDIADLRKIDINDETFSSSDEISEKDVKIEPNNEVGKNRVDMKQIDLKNIYLKSLKMVDMRKKPPHEVLNPDIFHIKELTTDEQKQVVRNRQESSNFKNSEYKCMECFKGFIDINTYSIHMMKHSYKWGAYVCEICKVRFKAQHKLTKHITQVHMYRLNCKFCLFVTASRNSAKLHEKYHNGTKYACPHCDEVFVKCTTYFSHLRIKHPTDIVCQLCGHSFVSDKGLQQHGKLKHRFHDRPVPANGPKCEECDITFMSEEALTTHRRLSPNHNEEQKSTTIQRKPFTRKKKSKLSEPVSCELCHMQLPDSYTYFWHFRRAHPGKNRAASKPAKYMCEVCGKMFTIFAQLQDHSWSHSDSKTFKCTQCNKSFYGRYGLRTHQKKIHTEHRELYECSLCGKMFTSKSNMQRHKFYHTGLRPFKCEVCGKYFKNVGERRTHVMYVHLKKPWPKRNRGPRRRMEGRKVQVIQQQQQSDESTSDMV